MTTSSPLTIAIAHDYLTQRGGAERVVLAFCHAFPEAEIHTSLYDAAGTFPEFHSRTIKLLWLDRLSPLRRRHRLAFPLLPAAWATASVDADVVLCSSSGWAHAIRTRGRKIVYCYSPAKWLYRPDDYLGARPVMGARVILRAISPALRRFDRWAAKSADMYLTSSSFIAEQIKNVYGIDATILPPPAGLDSTGDVVSVDGIDPGYLLTVARLLPYKNVDPTVRAFKNLEDLRLVVVGDGPQRDQLIATAPPNVTFLRRVDDDRLRWLYAELRGSRGCLSRGFRPDYNRSRWLRKTGRCPTMGRLSDTVVPGETGLYFDVADPDAIGVAVRALETYGWDANEIREHAANYREQRFIDEIRNVVQAAVLPR